jgi:CheY-like chemotaxis protein
MATDLNHPSIPAETQSTPRHILLVDDDFMMLNILLQHLVHRGYKVTAVQGCLEAIEQLLSEEKVDAMVLDYLMPDGNGTELLRYMADHEELQRPPVIFSSSILNRTNPTWKNFQTHLPEVARSLIRGFVSKPFTLQEMEYAIAMAVKPESAAPAAPLVSSGDYQTQATPGGLQITPLAEENNNEEIEWDAPE